MQPGLGAAAAGHAIHTSHDVSRSYIYRVCDDDDVMMSPLSFRFAHRPIRKRANDKTCNILMPNELKNAEHLTVRLGLQ